MKLIICLILKVILVLSHIDNGLLHFYPLRGNFENIKNLSLSINDEDHSNISLAKDRFGNPDKALQHNGNYGYIKMPNQVFNGLQNFTIAMWINPSYGTQQGERYFISVHSEHTHNELLIGTDRIYLRDQKYNFDLNFTQGEWLHFAVTRDVDNKQLQVQKNGEIIFTENNISGVTISCISAVLMQDQDSQFGGYESSQQFLGSFSDLRIYELVKDQQDIKSIKDDTYCLDSEVKDETKDQKCFEKQWIQACYENLQILDGRTSANQSVNNTCESYVENAQLNFKYAIQFLNNFIPNLSCLEFYFKLNGHPLNNWEYSQSDNNIKMNTTLNDLKDVYKCEIIESTKAYLYICLYEFSIYHMGEKQYAYEYQHQITINRLKQEEIDIQVKPNIAVGNCCHHDFNVSTVLNFCEDFTCSKYLNENELIFERQQEVYLEHNITSDEFKSFYIHGQQLSLGIYQVTPIAVNSTQPGRLIWKFIPSIASESIEVTSIALISLEKQRFLQEKDDPIQEKAQMTISIIDTEEVPDGQTGGSQISDQKDGQNNKNGESGQLFLAIGLSIGCTVIIFSIVLVVLYKKNQIKNKRRGADYRQTEFQTQRTDTNTITETQQ